ncbi:DR1-associated protein 1 (negative cofactor 2 alpha) [Rhizophlyctis rosea]|uniref:DR1-associated protein 1 (Negative cofactor 2 alpha) n=1 Tax=Rhizophlyctis rosea TaxID=64517 RepID=A0AAD5SMA6_9FUNG|nr:DR1-associated protein 1 (negative cofactor 2 alpha) [Rhizophlyctis rosea]
MQKKYKTKFPVARIKKIMRTDEEVGKVAQVTPVLISKALELFIQSLIEETCKEMQSRGLNKMQLTHLKKTIMEVEKFDFLKDQVAGVPDFVEPKEDEGEEGGDSKRGGRGVGKGQAKGKGRAKKEEA